MPLKKGDFIEIKFTGKIQDGGIFDSNIAEDLKKLNPKFNKNQTKPFVFCLGHDMFLKGVEEFLIGKEIGEYTIDLESTKAFGKRNPQLIQRVPTKVFQTQNVNPVPGASFNFDGKIGKILTSSGGRVLVDFNNPLAGKDVSYFVKVIKKVDDQNEKIKALNDFLFRKELDFTVKDKKLTIKVEKQMLPYLVLFKDKYKDLLGLDLDAKEIEDKKEEKKEN